MTLEITHVGIDVGGRIIILEDLEAELRAAAVPIPNGLSIMGPPRTEPLPPGNPLEPWPAGSWLYTYDDQANPVDLPPEALPIVQNYQPS